MSSLVKSALQWSKKIESSSAVRDGLGLWNHLIIQTDFTPGITSVTDRIRYYTNLAWYWKNLRSKVSPKNFERIFILKCLAHHNGDSKSPHLINVFNKTRFDGEWHSKNVFDLSFNINGFGKIYYNTQLQILRCAWTDFAGSIQLTPINDKLASCLSTLSADDFLHETFSTEFLNNRLEGFCVCDSETNDKEIELMSKLFFGFFSSQNGVWDIDESEFQNFLKGKIELGFETNVTPTDELDLESVTMIRQMSLRRRNTLFLFLKVINETQPEPSKLRSTLWDATYFSQNRTTKQYIKFNRLETVRLYWEFFQLNVYYVYALEMILDAIQLLVRRHSGVDRASILGIIQHDEFYAPIDKLLGSTTDGLTISSLFQKLWEKNSNRRTNLNSPINEALVYVQLDDTEQPEHILSLALVMLMLLRKRFEETDETIRNYRTQERVSKIFDEKLTIKLVLGNLLEASGTLSLLEYMSKLVDLIIERHLFESSIRLSGGTTKWILTEEESRLYPARHDIVDFDARDNRWDSILHLLRDTGFVVVDNEVKLTQKGLLWLKLIG